MRDFWRAAFVLTGLMVVILVSGLLVVASAMSAVALGGGLAQATGNKMYGVAMAFWALASGLAGADYMKRWLTGLVFGKKGGGGDVARR